MQYIQRCGGSGLVHETKAMQAYSRWGLMKDVYNLRRVSDEEYL
jgi:hypothetical protein